MATQTLYKTRLRSLRRELAAVRVPALLVTDPANIAYLTGFTGTSGAALVSADRLCLVVDCRYVTQAVEQAPHAELCQVLGAAYDDAVVEAIRELGVAKLGFEADALEVARHMAIEWKLPELALVPTRGLVERGREVKDALELAKVRQAAAITSAAIDHALALARPGMTERELAAAVEAELWRLGAEGLAFPTLVASGERAALPHPSPSGRTLAAGDWLLIDAGARVDGYRADMTRTIVLGEPTPQQRAAFEAVEAALAAGLAAVKPGATGRDVDAACRQALAAHGLDAAFFHDAGHGVGLGIHEAPRLAADSDDELAVGMVITVEPGLYAPGWGGVRLEQLAVVTAMGAEVLTTAPVSLSAPCRTAAGRL